MLVAILIVTGHDPALVRSMSDVAIRQLGMIAVARLLAAVTIAASAGIAVWESLASQALSAVLWSLSAAVGTFILLFSIQRLAACISGPGLIRADDEVDGWRPGRYRVVLMLMVGSIAAQPLIMIWQKADLEVSIRGRVNELTLVQVTRQREALIAGDAALRLERAELAERLAFLQVEATDVVAPKPEAPPSIVQAPRRNALLVGAQNYPRSPLNNPARDVAQMAEKLTAMGFTVTTSVDDRGEVVESKLNRYFAALRPGDISLVYYSGHGFQRDGHNYLIPIDFDAEKNLNAIRITRFLEAADRSSPQLQVIILDACREFFDDGLKVSSGGLAELQGGNNSFIAMAAKPGELALDGPRGTSGVFTGAILRYIDRPEDINVIFRRISADVVQDARKMDFIQQPVITSTLTREYVQLVDPRISRPVSLLEIPELPVGESNVPAIRAATDVETPCAPPPGADSQFQLSTVRQCLTQRIAAIDKVLADWRAAGSGILQSGALAYRDALRSSGLFTEKMQIIWSAAPVMTAAVTTFIALLLAVGEFLHLGYAEAVVEYVRRRNRRAVDSIKGSHFETMQMAERRLIELRHPDYAPLEGFRTPMAWHGPEIGTAGWVGGSRWATDSERIAIEKWLGGPSGTAAVRSL
jgi:hypothetical protein